MDPTRSTGPNTFVHDLQQISASTSCLLAYQNRYLQGGWSENKNREDEVFSCLVTKEGQNYSVRKDDKFFENVAKFKYLVTIVKIKITSRKNKGRINSGNDFYNSVLKFYLYHILLS
jgi:hypothetical protein